MSCSSHSPPASHTGQSSGWLPSSNSTMLLRAWWIFVAVGGDDHAFADHRGAGGLQLGHLLDLHQAHAASALQREIRVIAERGHFDAHALAGLNQQRPRGSRDLLAVHRDVYVSHNRSASIRRLSRGVRPRASTISTTSIRPQRSRDAGVTPSPATAHRPPFQTGTACLPDDLQIPCGTFSRIAIVGMAAASPSGQNVRPSMFSERY